MIEDRLVQNRDCPECGKPQTRRQGSDGKFKRWTRCDCPPKTKKLGVAAGSSSDECGMGVPTARSSHSEPAATPDAAGYLHRDTVTRIDKR